jgi:hypothetical protein
MEGVGAPRCLKSNIPNLKAITGCDRSNERRLVQNSARIKSYSVSPAICVVVFADRNFRLILKFARSNESITGYRVGQG